MNYPATFRPCLTIHLRSFHFTIYTSFVIYGLWTLWDKEYIELYDVDYTGYPYHTQGRDVQWWYFLETGFYLSALVTMFRWQHRR